tara:strand:+ start:11945 stop:12664 length:720 start_codon:yes stop_codon:yes gene_type:complete
MSNQRNNKNTNWKVNCERMSTARRDKVTDGDNAIIFNTDTNNYEAWDGTGWSSLSETISEIGERLIGWQDFADSNTSEDFPLVQPLVNGGEVQLTNNNNDTLTDGNTNVNGETSIQGLNDLYDTSTNTFIFDGTGIEKNDLISFRVHLNIAASIITSDFSLRIDFFDAPGGTGNQLFSLSQHLSTESLSAGVFRERIVTIDAFVGESILNGSAKLFVEGTKSFEVEVIGYNLRIFKIAR